MTDATSPTVQRLEDQIAWCDKKSHDAQTCYKRLKLVQLFTAGIIPVLAIFSIPGTDRVTAILGLVILVVERLQQLNQYQTNWISYRSTCKVLSHRGIDRPGARQMAVGTTAARKTG